MQSELFFARQKLSALDQNPWQVLKADKIIDYGFSQGTGPRVGVVTIKMNKDERQCCLKMTETAAQQIVTRAVGSNFEVTAHVG